tara:strand:+ start:236 stop:1456 length:1221 start_codon:yes stop_codon:yes gene_type:complete
MVWSVKRDSCTNCGTSLVPHAGHGLCRKCYTARSNHDYSAKNTVGREVGLNKKITKELLEELYIEKQLSLQEIAKIFGCNRQNIQYWKKKYKIEGRSKSQARKIAYKKGKIIQKYESKNFKGIVSNLTKCNLLFFKNWSSDMAYCLGVIYSDGNIYLGKNHGNINTNWTGCRLSIGQKDPEILENIKILMDCNAKLYEHKERVNPSGIKSGKIYSIQINKAEIVRDLMALGLEPNKSMTMKFPEVPEQFQRHYIRGLWDGDGSIRILNKNSIKPHWRCDYVCGSLSFLKSMMGIFHKNNIKNIRLYKPPNVEAHYLIIEKDEIPSIFNYFYKDVNKNARYSKKYELFKLANDNILLKKYSENQKVYIKHIQDMKLKKTKDEKALAKKKLLKANKLFKQKLSKKNNI